MCDLISRQKAIEALCQDSCGSGWCGVSCQEVVVLENLPSAQPDLCDGCDRYEVSCVGEGCGKLEAPKEEHTEERTETHACEKEKKAMNDDAKFQAHILSEICCYALEQDMDPDDTVRAVANNLLAMLDFCTFKNWKEGE